MKDLHRGILEEFNEAASPAQDDSVKAWSMHLAWHTQVMQRNLDKTKRYQASLANDEEKREKRLAAKRAVAKAAYNKKRSIA